MEATDVAPSASPLKLLLRPSILIVMCDVRKDGDWTELDITEPMASTIWGEHIPSVIPWMYANECRGDRSGRPIHTPQGSLSITMYECGKTIRIVPDICVWQSFVGPGDQTGRPTFLIDWTELGIAKYPTFWCYFRLNAWQNQQIRTFHLTRIFEK